jgi:hypothetical protein
MRADVTHDERARKFVIAGGVEIVIWATTRSESPPGLEAPNVKLSGPV